MGKGFKLKPIDQDGCIDEYLRVNRLYEQPSNRYRGGEFQPNPAKNAKNLELLRKMKANPKDYFNFKLTLEDYSRVLMKHVYMRVERDSIKKSVEESSH
jgi:hypothetical protein